MLLFYILTDVHAIKFLIRQLWQMRHENGGEFILNLFASEHEVLGVEFFGLNNLVRCHENDSYVLETIFLCRDLSLVISLSLYLFRRGVS